MKWLRGLWAVNALLLLALLLGLIRLGTRGGGGAVRAEAGLETSVPARAAASPTPTAFQPVTLSPPTATPSPTPLPPTATPVPLVVLPTPPPALYPLIIGHSVEGRPLKVYRFGSGADVRLIVAGIHGGNEWNTIALANQLLDYLRQHPETVPPDVTLLILPNLNPDGEARAHGVDGRVNANGVDLNRNWPYRWQAEWDRDGCWQYRPVTAGSAPASEPETAALMAFIQTWRPTALISYHSAALGVFAGGVPDYPPSIRLAETLAAAGGYAYPPLNTGCDYTGNLTDWAASVMGIPAVDIELTNHEDTDFEQNLRVLEAFLRWQP